MNLPTKDSNLANVRGLVFSVQDSSKDCQRAFETVQWHMNYSSSWNQTETETEDFYIDPIFEWTTSSGQAFHIDRSRKLWSFNTSDLQHMLSENETVTTTYLNTYRNLEGPCQPWFQELWEKHLEYTTAEATTTTNRRLRPPMRWILLIQIASLASYILTHYVTRKYFRNDVCAVTRASSLVSFWLVVVVMGPLEAFNDSVQGPVWVAFAIVANPILLLNCLNELGYTWGSAAVSTSCMGALLKVVSSLFVGALVKISNSFFGFHSSSQGVLLWLLALLLGSVGGVCLTLHSTTLLLFTRQFLPSRFVRTKWAKLSSQEEIVDNEEEVNTSTHSSNSRSSSSNDSELDGILKEHEVENSVSSKTESRMVWAGFLSLIIFNTSWVMTQLWLSKKFDFNGGGFVCLDQIYGGLFVVFVTSCAERGFSTTSSRDNLRESEGGRTSTPLDAPALTTTGRSSCPVVGWIHQSWGPVICLTVSKLLANGVLAMHFYLSTTYDPSLVIVEVGVMKVMFSLTYTVVAAKYFPGFLAFSAEERQEILCEQALLQRAVGSCLVLASIAILHLSTET